MLKDFIDGKKNLNIAQRDRIIDFVLKLKS